jgi:hypothetical protein
METQLKTQPLKRQRKENFSDEEEIDDLSFPRFLVASGNDDQPIKYNVFAIQKFIQCGVGDVKCAKKLRNGTVLIEVLTKEQAKKALAMRNWFDTEITVTPHRALNSSRGVIRCRELRDCSDDEVLAALQSQGVTAVKHILTKRSDKVEPTNTFILTFNTPTPPKDIRAAYLKIDVDPYIPNPLRCFKCQKFGHGKAACGHNTVCARCGQEGHEDSGCEAAPHCVNCSGDHPAHSRECPTWCKQREITSVKFTKGISFHEAKKIVEQRGSSSTQRVGASYASVCSQTKKTDMSTQTDFTWPRASESPVLLYHPVSADSESQTGSPVRPAGGAAGANQSLPKTQNTNKQTTSENSNPKRMNTKPGPAPYRSSSGKRTYPAKPPKGSNDPIKTFNRFGSLDNMELEVNRSPSPRARSKQKVQQNG